MGKSMDELEGSCSQNTVKNKRLEHQSYRQNRNFIDRKPGAPECGRAEAFIYVRLLP
jgi:hypothetical protein